jgi:hypothetical protein
MIINKRENRKIYVFNLVPSEAIRRTSRMRDRKPAGGFHGCTRTNHKNEESGKRG